MGKLNGSLLDEKPSPEKILQGVPQHLHYESFCVKCSSGRAGRVSDLLHSLNNAIGAGPRMDSRLIVTSI